MSRMPFKHPPEPGHRVADSPEHPNDADETKDRAALAGSSGGYQSRRPSSASSALLSTDIRTGLGSPRTEHTTSSGELHSAHFRRPSDPVSTSVSRRLSYDSMPTTLPSHSLPPMRSYPPELASSAMASAVHSEEGPAATSSGSSSGNSSRAAFRPGSAGRGKTIRLPSLASIAGDLPDFKHYHATSSLLSMTGEATSRQHSRSPPDLSGPTRSRRSASSRGSSPYSASSSSGSRRRSGMAFATQDQPNNSRTLADAPAFRYELIIQQQPGIAAATGLNPAALSRLPIVPSPILQLRVTDQNGDEVPYRHIIENLPYLVCSCSLISPDEAEDGSSVAIDFAARQDGDTGRAQSPSPLAMLCGTRAYSAVEAIDTGGVQGLFFILWDVSVRQIGTYRLKFTLVEALPGSLPLATATSQPFDTVPSSRFPGNVAIATELSRHFHQQGLAVYLPPLGFSSPTTSS